jgi:hypothetical protein
MNGLTSWIKRYPLAIFFIISFAITWGMGAFAIFLPAQFHSLFGEISDTHPLYHIAVAAPTISASILALALEGRHGLGICSSARSASALGCIGISWCWSGCRCLPG